MPVTTSAPKPERILVLLPPARPLVIFDGHCNFCRFWIRRCQSATKGRVDFIASQNPEMILQFPEIPRQRFKESVQLVETSGVVFDGAEAVFRLLSHSWIGKLPLRLYQKIPGVKPLTEAVYHFVAGHRTFFSRLTRFIFRADY